MKILLTGAPGWLGNRCLEVFLNGYHGEGSALPAAEFRCLVLPGTDLSSFRKIYPVAEIAEGDVRDPSSLKKAVQGIDAVVHLVGVIHPKKVLDWTQINAEGTRHLIQACVEAGVRRVIHISSNSVAGTTRQPVLMTETDLPNPYLGYGRSKYQAEQFVQNGCRRHGLEAVILRPCWYYGPGQPDRQTRFLKMIKNGHPLIFGNGQNLRSMSYLDNTIQAIIQAIRTPVANGQVYWIADEKPYKTIEIYETVARLLNVKKMTPRYLPDLISEACLAADTVLQAAGIYISEIHVAGELNKHIACSIEKAKKELGYAPAVGLEEGWRRSIDWCRKTGVEI